MSVAEKSYIPVPVPKKRQSRRSSVPVSRLPTAPEKRSSSPTGRPDRERPVATKKTSFPPRPLSLLQKIVSVITFSLLGSTLGIYAWTVYIPKVWDQEFGKLETLQLHERNLLATNETLKHQLAEQAEQPETGFGKPQPFQTIFLQRSADTKLKTPTAPRSQAIEIASRKAY